MKHAIVLLLLYGLLAGCTISYKAVGRYTDGSEKFIGDVDASIFGGGDISVKSVLSGAECNGRAEVTNTGNSMACAGQAGSLNLTCSDGRILSGTWKATACTTGVGEGLDNNGRPIEFIFGLTEDQANAFIAK